LGAVGEVSEAEEVKEVAEKHRSPKGVVHPFLYFLNLLCFLNFRYFRGSIHLLVILLSPNFYIVRV